MSAPLIVTLKLEPDPDNPKNFLLGLHQLGNPASPLMGTISLGREELIKGVRALSSRYDQTNDEILPPTLPEYSMLVTLRPIVRL